MEKLDFSMLGKIADITDIPSVGAYNIRKNGLGVERKSTENIEIVPKTDKNGILSNSDRVFLKDKGIELSPDSEYQTYEELALIYSSLTSAEDKLFLSYSLHDESNKSITPSQVVHNIKDI